MIVAWEKFKVWWNKHSAKVLGVAIVVALVIFGIRTLKQRAADTREHEQWLLATETGPDSFRELASLTSNDAVELQANLRGADLLLARVARPSESGQNALTAEERKVALDKAEGMCRAVSSASKHPLLTINARMRLASIAEARGQWDQAKVEYQAVQKDAAGAGNEYFQKLAVVHEKMIARLQSPPVFAKEEPKVEKSDPFKLDPLKLTPDPTKTDPTTTDPTKSGPGFLDPLKIDPAKDGKPDPAKDAKVDPAKDAKPDPAKVDPTKPDPAKVDPAKVDPAKPKDGK